MAKDGENTETVHWIIEKALVGVYSERLQFPSRSFVPSHTAHAP
jgi:hypothetical protein